MPRGGPRPNQTGRPKGSKSNQQSATLTPTARAQVTKKLVEKVAGMNLSPLEVMLDDMKLRHDLKRKVLEEHEAEQDNVRRGELLGIALEHSAAAVESAAKAAPYVHAKLQTTTLKGDAENPLELALGLASIEDLKAAVRGAN